MQYWQGLMLQKEWEPSFSNRSNAIDFIQVNTGKSPRKVKPWVGEVCLSLSWTTAEQAVLADWISINTHSFHHSHWCCWNLSSPPGGSARLRKGWGWTSCSSEEAESVPGKRRKMKNHMTWKRGLHGQGGAKERVGWEGAPTVDTLFPWFRSVSLTLGQRCWLS